MTLERREFLRLASIVAGGAALAACSPIYRELSGLPSAVSGWDPISPFDYQVLSRLTYGPTIEERQQITQLGWKSWVEYQLSQDQIEDQGVLWRLRPYDALTLDADALALWDQGDVSLDLQRGALLRQAYSRKQLYERMVEFWTDHFNISVMKGDCWFLKVVDDRQVIRQHALGNFRDLLWASAHSPAMLVYLDNQANEGRAPNENYARELMELHTLGVNGGYTQKDVMELARCFTGWSVKDRFWRGEFTFNEDFHDQGSKVVLGTRIVPAGQREAELVLEQLALHPATAHRLSRKLVRKFVTEEDAPALIESAAQVFLRSQGSIRDTLGHILEHGLEFTGDKVKRPTDFIVGGIRMLGADTDGGQPLQTFLAQMGQPAFQWPTPDGPPVDSNYWTSNLMPRWRFAVAFSQNGIGGTKLQVEALMEGKSVESDFDRLSELLLGTRLEPKARDQLLAALSAGGATDQRTLMELTIAGLLASPGFQWM
ncbi:MAG: DUF1800 domain-containing protein [Anaerolineales bacterium]